MKKINISEFNGFLSLIIILLLISCSKESSNSISSNNPSNPTNPTTPVAKNVYVSGIEVSGQNFVPVYWKNGVKTQLSNVYSETYDIFVSGSDVYVVGYEGAATHYPVMWKNGVKTQLSSRAGEAYSVFVSGSDVYVCGVEILGTTNSGQSLAFLWKNGVKVNYGYNSGASSVFVRGYDVFVAGTNIRNGKSNATYWQNGKEADYMPITGSSASDIFVAGSELYVIGRDHTSNLPVLWRKTFGSSSNLHTQTPLSTKTNSWVSSIAVAGGTAYITGYEDGACYWKNGVRTQLSTNKESTAAKVFTFENDFYIAGRGGNNLMAGYWKNGIRVDMPSHFGSYATSIFVD